MSDKLREALVVSGCYMRMDCGDQHNDPECDPCRIDAAARAYLDRQEPDYKAALEEWLGLHGSAGQTPKATPLVAKRIVDAALAGRRLVVEIEEN